ncbi:hypothetical protein [Nonomuraea sp. NPDC049695]|uniref:hypothetical protein n=1 Tax=Nonomuraea sp. NPDC049695 TaxID=3154734 RepID=UPI00342873F9
MQQRADGWELACDGDLIGRATGGLCQPGTQPHGGGRRVECRLAEQLPRQAGTDGAVAVVPLRERTTTDLAERLRVSAGWWLLCPTPASAWG